MADVNVDDVKETVEDAGEKVTGGGNGAGGGSGLIKRYGIPAAAGVGTLAATYAARKVPDLLRNNVMPKAEEKGGEEAAKMGKKALDQMKDQGGVGGLAAKALSLGGGGKGKGGQKKTRRLPIQRWTDISAPRAKVYDTWTHFEDFPKFMHRVLSVQQDDNDENKVRWEEKIWFSKRQWEGEVTERDKNEKIAWKTVSGTSHEGVISFHKLDDNLTRVMVTMDFHPSGMIEKMGSGLRFAKRAVQADLARFKAYVELGEAEGLEYSHDTEAGEKQDKRQKENKQRQKEEEKQDEQDENGDDSDGDGQQSRSQSSGNGSRSDSDSDASSDEEQEQARQQRAERRQQRRS